MHSRIFQLERFPGDIEDNCIYEEDFYDMDAPYEWFIGTVADYVSENVDKQADIDWLISTLSRQAEFITINDDDDEDHISITFLSGFKHAYFERRYHEFRNRASNMSLETFTNDTEIFTVERLIKDKFGFYIYSSYYGLLPLDSFVRQLDNNQEHTFYFGTTLDYHY